MYKVIKQEEVVLGTKKRYLGQRAICRFCETDERSAFGKRDNAHTFPESLGNRTLFSLDECKHCNKMFSIYEDALCKAIGPFLTLGGVIGKNGVRQTGRSKGNYLIKHSIESSRHLLVKLKEPKEKNFQFTQNQKNINIHFPVSTEKFIPLYAYKSLLKIAISILPDNELQNFTSVRSSLLKRDKLPERCILPVNFSYCSVGNAPPNLTGMLLRRTSKSIHEPYLLAYFQAGSVCFQIALCPDDEKQDLPYTLPNNRWVLKVPGQNNNDINLVFCNPYTYDWSSLEATFQPFNCFDVAYNTETLEAVLTPSIRNESIE